MLVCLYAKFHAKNKQSGAAASAITILTMYQPEILTEKSKIRAKSHRKGKKHLIQHGAFVLQTDITNNRNYLASAFLQ